MIFYNQKDCTIITFIQRLCKLKNGGKKFLIDSHYKTLGQFFLIFEMYTYPLMYPQGGDTKPRWKSHTLNLALSLLLYSRFIESGAWEQKSVADPGFPRGGGANSQGGAPTYDFVNFRRKLHENEEILAAGGARVPCAPPLDPPLKIEER